MTQGQLLDFFKIDGQEFAEGLFTSTPEIGHFDSATLSQKVATERGKIDPKHLP
jgi:hypothetical protein